MSSVLNWTPELEKFSIFHFSCSGKINPCKTYRDLLLISRPLSTVFQKGAAPLIPLVFHQNEWSQIKANCLWSPVINYSQTIQQVSNFVTFFLCKKDIRYQYINSFQVNCFLYHNIKIHTFTSLTGLGLFKVILSRLVFFYYIIYIYILKMI
jgi:hypothetical protein